jgi:hypothetical protein
MKTPVNYPQYRKYPNERGYFKIISIDEWEEIQVIGSNYKLHCFKASILPDRNFIYDLTFDYKNNWLEIEAEEYERVRNKI